MAVELLAPMTDMFNGSRLMILDFSQIPPEASDEENIQKFFNNAENDGINPRLPENRQVFNNRMLGHTSMRYLVSRYGENRSEMLAGSQIAEEGRTLHMGIDVFSRDLEAVFVPCDGRIILADYEHQDHGYGHYLLLEPDESVNLDVFLFFGHLSKSLPELGKVRAGQQIAQLGDFTNAENGGWSRHLHLQMCRELPPENETPIGYSTSDNFAMNSHRFPNPMDYFTDWHIAS